MKIDITTGSRKFNTVADVDDALMDLLEELRAREAAEVATPVNILPDSQ